jgi:hypothetical protein
MTKSGLGVKVKLSGETLPALYEEVTKKKFGLSKNKHDEILDTTGVRFVRMAMMVMGLGRHPGSFVPPRLHEAMHAVVSAIIASSAQFLEQPLGGAPIASGQPGLRLQNLGQNLNPVTQLRHSAL